MIDSQVTQMRCGDCRTLFQQDTPVNVAVHLWAAWVSAIRCPSCGSSKALFGQGRSLSEDASFEWGKSLAERAGRWLLDGETGGASDTIHAHMTGQSRRRTPHPEDVADLRRCMLLLIRIPEWQSRMGEMAPLSEEWGYFARAWPMLTNLFLEEAGADLDKYPTPRTSALVAACACKGELVFERLSEAEILAGESHAGQS